jgi:hypothetical protein
MKKIIEFFKRLVVAFLSPKQEPCSDLTERVKALYTNSLVIEDLFPDSKLNVAFIILPEVYGAVYGLDECLKNNDGVVSVVITGKTANKIVKTCGYVPEKVAAFLVGELSKVRFASTVLSRINTKVLPLKVAIEVSAPAIVLLVEQALTGLKGDISVH